MILDMDVSIALKNCYGHYDIKSFSLFEIDKINESFTSLKVKVINRGVAIKVSCPICCNYHHYRYSVNEFIKRDLIIGGCEIIGLPLFYIGNYDKVKQRVDRHNDVNKSICAMI